MEPAPSPPRALDDGRAPPARGLGGALVAFAAARPWAWLALYTALTTALYQLALRAPVFTPIAVPPTALDRLVPLVPTTAFVYATYFALMPSFVFATRGHAARGVRRVAAALVVLGNLTLNLLVPTALAAPLDAAALAAQAAEATRAAEGLGPLAALDAAGLRLLATIVAVDTPRAALPSGHLSLPAALFVLSARAGLRAAPLYAAWALALGVVILTTKQHVALDALAALVLAGLGAAAAELLLAAPRGARGAVRRARPWIDVRSVGAMVLELALAIAGAVAAAAAWRALAGDDALGLARAAVLAAGLLAALVVVATRQHALFILYHDAVHGLVARDRRVNDLITNVLVGLPQLIPVEVYRRLHLAHHARLGRADDPERLLLYRDQRWRYRPLGLRALALQLAGDLALVNNLRTALAFARMARDPTSPLALPRGRPIDPAVIVLGAAALLALGMATLAWPDLVGRALVVWVGVLLTGTQLIQKVRSFAEHADADAPERSYSWRPSLAARLVLWPYNIQYHREHHARPHVPWHRLPAIASAETPPHVPRSLRALLWSGRA